MNCVRTIGMCRRPFQEEEYRPHQEPAARAVCCPSKRTGPLAVGSSEECPQLVLVSFRTPSRPPPLAGPVASVQSLLLSRPVVLHESSDVSLPTCGVYWTPFSAALPSPFAPLDLLGCGVLFLPWSCPLPQGLRPVLPGMIFEPLLPCSF